ncbi:MAG: M20/M25/M40 family metallo-hydrolase [Isosphaeraceae bacterium]|nr:M20/M25/M40 family metallo-hydrolase [Isosphaeraceae bacterium]
MSSLVPIAARPLARAILAIAILGIVGPASIAGDEGKSDASKAAPLDPARLREHVETLASPEFGGRSGPDAEKSREYLEKEFRRIGLRPLFAGSFRQPVPGVDPAFIAGENVGGFLPGSDPALASEWVILAAHFDHLGRRGSTLYPGADDNATGVAMMLETARVMAESPIRPKRSIAFVGFDLEEAGLWGSRYFARESPIDLTSVHLFVTADMIGRALAGIFERRVFVMGSEHAPEYRSVIEAAARSAPLEVGILGADVLLVDRSDYGPFRSRNVPFLFFSTGENPHYHKPTDVAATIDYPKFTAISNLIHAVVRNAADRPDRTLWKSIPEPSIAEARTIREVFRTMLENRDRLKINAAQAFLMSRASERLEGILRRGVITPEERTPIIRVVQGVLATLF